MDALLARSRPLTEEQHLLLDTHATRAMVIELRASTVSIGGCFWRKAQPRASRLASIGSRLFQQVAQTHRASDDGLRHDHRSATVMRLTGLALKLDAQTIRTIVSFTNPAVFEWEYLNSYLRAEHLARFTGEAG